MSNNNPHEAPTEALLAAFSQGVRDAITTHRALGEAIVIGVEGAPVWIPAEAIPLSWTNAASAPGGGRAVDALMQAVDELADAVQSASLEEDSLVRIRHRRMGIEQEDLAVIAAHGRWREELDEVGHSLRGSLPAMSQTLGLAFSTGASLSDSEVTELLTLAHTLDGFASRATHLLDFPLDFTTRFQGARDHERILTADSRSRLNEAARTVSAFATVLAFQLATVEAPPSDAAS